MTNLKCALCGVELGPENDSAEHLISNSIGGMRRVKGVYCVPCNNSTGSLWDAEVARQFKFLALRLGVVRDRGTLPSGTFATASGEPVNIHSDGTLSFPPTKPVVVKEENAVQIASRVRTRAEAKKTLRGLKRTYPKLDIDAAMQNIVEENSYLSEPVIAVTVFGGPKAGRSAVKSALTLAVSAGVAAQSCNLALGYLKNEAAGPCFGFYSRRDLVTNRPNGRVFHCVAIEGDRAAGRLTGYVEFFSVYRMVIGLSDCYSGPSLKAVYAIDPTNGKELELDIDLTFTEDELRFALADEDDSTAAQLRAMNEVMAIAQELSFKREQARVARLAYQTTLSKLDLKPGQDMTPDIALAMSKEITAQMLPFLQHSILPHRGRR
jgi:HNH endonuclease